MRKFCILTCMLMWSLLFFAQSQSPILDSLEQGLASKTGENFIQDALTISEIYFVQKKFGKAARYADEAHEKAAAAGLKEPMAKALNYRAMAVMNAPNARRKVLNQAYKTFQESNKLTIDQSLHLSNFEGMLAIAERLNRKKDIERLRTDIAILKGEKLPEEDVGGGLFARRKRALEKYQQVQQEKENLNEELNELAELTEEQKLRQQQLQEQQAALINMVEQKEAAIKLMTDEQIRQQLLVSEQERIVDSMTFVSILDSFELAQTEMLVEQQESDLREQESELELKQTQQRLLIAVAAGILLLAIGLFHRFHVISKHNAVLAEKNKIIEEERKRNEELLLNILPKAIADELKSNGVAETQHYDEATVLFADFKGFSRISKQLSAEKLVADLDYAFKHFDEIIGRHGLEKIKTIGDAYMCAGGLPAKNGAHPTRVVQAALEMQDFLRNWNGEKEEKDEPVFEARIGIHTGPLIAGVVGSKKFAYDIWGDTVNVASRMESSSEAGRVNISKATFGHVKDAFECEYRGKVPAKNVGEVEMYYVNAPAA